MQLCAIGKVLIKETHRGVQREMTKIQKKMAITFGRAKSSDRNSNFWGIKINVKSKPETPTRNRNGMNANKLLPQTEIKHNG